MTATDVRRSFQSSELSRNSAELFDAASDHPVEVTHRDRETMVLMTEREDSARTALLELAGQVIAAVTTIRSGTLADRLSDRFPWMLALSEVERDEAAAEIIEAARASFSTSQAHLALSTIHAWRETATAIAAGLSADSVEWIDSDNTVERP